MIEGSDQGVLTQNLLTPSVCGQTDNEARLTGA